MTDHLDIAATAAGFTIDANPLYAPGPFPNRAGSLDDAVMRAAADEITGWVGYAPTPLHDLPEIAKRLGVARVVFKDESARFGLGSFKALGGAYAVAYLAKQAEAAGTHPVVRRGCGDTGGDECSPRRRGRDECWRRQL